MGNFKHHSMRAGDRDREKDRDRDADKDRERDVRDKDGHERLRHLSDKYDRDRLALPLSSRTKDPAPHLSAGPSSRTGGQSHLVPSSRRDARDPTKKRAGEASEDWRKGSDARSTREERTDSTRRDRDELGKSRVRDSSKSRREFSPSRRDREREPDRELDDDPRRWRDDGKRDERLAARRPERHLERSRDKDGVLDPADRRWFAAEEREGRAKRPTGRDRKPIDEVKDRDDRRDREREKEKEPAWMDTYVPSSVGGGILGGKAGDGELDGIQAWKKERKEKELKDKVDVNPTKGTTSSTQESVQNSDNHGAPLDEIQIFRLLMKREEEKKKVDATEDVSRAGTEDFIETPAVVQDCPPLPSNNPTTHHENLDRTSFSDGTTLTPSIQASSSPEAGLETSAPMLLSLLGAKDASSSLGTQISSDINKLSLSPSNTTNTPPIQEYTHQTYQNTDVSRDAVPQFNPPPGSRLLAFARTAPKSQNTPSNAVINGPIDPPPNFALQQTEFPLPISSKSDNLRPLPGFSPFEDQNRSHGFEDFSSLATVSPDPNRRTTTERSTFTPPTEHPQFPDPMSPENGNGYPANKGSRFAKFFDSKGREGAPITSKTPAGLVSSSPGSGSQRPEHGFSTNQGNGPDLRAMDEIYAMLSSSGQAPRDAPFLSTIAPLPNNGGFGLQPQNNLHLLQQQQIHTNCLEPLYESRLDDRTFVPDGMVPGLRAAPPRARDNPPMYSDNVEDGPFNVQQRFPHQQQRNFEQLYPGGPPSLYGQQVNRNSVPLQANQYRGAPSPLSHQQNHLLSSQQRLPPGLANLGGRPPHEPSQLIGMPGISNPGLPSALHPNGANHQQPFNSFSPGGNLGYGSSPPVRGPHQPQSQGAHLSMAGHLNNLDPRTPGQSQLLGMGGGAGGLRNTGVFFSGQQAGGHMPPLLAMRQQQQLQQQQQQQQLPPQMMSHILPPHMQHHVPNSSQPAHDLMSLLMGGTPRE
ncbi:hypothetical protein C0995_005735 [Termitomyces sp. Mi166|nr:hypothetical protein C0995_005735 [Termitomyces sp. Mi166\